MEERGLPGNSRSSMDANDEFTVYQLARCLGLRRATSNAVVKVFCCTSRGPSLATTFPAASKAFKVPFSESNETGEEPYPALRTGQLDDHRNDDEYLRARRRLPTTGRAGMRSRIGIEICVAENRAIHGVLRADRGTRGTVLKIQQGLCQGVPADKYKDCGEQGPLPSRAQLSAHRFFTSLPRRGHQHDPDFHCGVRRVRNSHGCMPAHRRLRLYVRSAAVGAEGRTLSRGRVATHSPRW